MRNDYVSILMYGLFQYSADASAGDEAICRIKVRFQTLIDKDQ